MHAALETDDTVQHYIEAMLFDASAESAAPVQAATPRPPAHNQALPSPVFPAECDSSASVITMTALQPLRANSLALAIHQLRHGLQAGSVTAPASSQNNAGESAEAVESTQVRKDAEMRVVERLGAAVDNPQASPAGPDQDDALATPPRPASGAASRHLGPARGAAFLRHLEVAQARTANKLAGDRRKRPAALAKAPAWVESEQLRCLVFKVANLQLALPTQYLAGVAPFAPEQLCEPDAVELEQWQSAFAEICMGSVDGDLLLDTARLVMPERYQPAMREEYRQMVRISDMRWRFAVDGIGREAVFNAGDVRWRSQHTRREWLAGTVIDQMCAIVDVDALHRNLLAASVLGEPGS